MTFNPLYFWLALKSVFSYEWENPLFLYFLALPFILIFLNKLITRKNQPRIVLSLPVPFIQHKFIRILSFIPETTQILCLLCVILAISSPYKKISRTEIKTEGVEMAIAMDISSSMLSQDVSPSRLIVAKNLAIEFLKNRNHDNISLIAFAGSPYLASPSTQDTAFLIQSISRFETNLIPEEGTALGDALGMSINQIRDEKNPKKVAIIISDGNNTAGNLDPLTSAELAKSFGIKVYTIAVGSIKPSLDPVDETTLRLIAQHTQGKFFRATDAQALKSIFSEIDLMERSRKLLIKIEEHKDLKGIFNRLALGLFLIHILLKITPISNILED